MGIGATGSCPPTTGGGGSGSATCVGCAIGWAVACGISSFGLNQVGVPGSDASGTRGAHDGTCKDGADEAFAAGAGSAAGPGAHAGRAAGPDWDGLAGGVGAAWAGWAAAAGGAGAGSAVTGLTGGCGWERVGGAGAGAEGWMVAGGT